MVPPGSANGTTLVLIRHGESACSVAGVVGGAKGCTGLSERGTLEAEALRDRLLETGELARASALYASVLERAVQTATIAAPGIGGGLPVNQDCSLCELHPGEGDGLTWGQFVDRYGEPDFDVDPGIELSPGGESWSAFVRRATDALARVAASHPGELVVVVCHAGVIEASLSEFLPVARERGRLKLRTGHTSLTEWELRETTWNLHRYNDTGHLSRMQAAAQR
jgi:probable phosphoglycerate mutase